jgi:hypothetical protein
MPTPFESAQLNLQLFDLRREPVLREARSWFLLDFHPQTLADFVAAVSFEQGLSVAAIGCVIGLALSLGLSRAMAGLLFGVARFDPATLSGVLFSCF